MTEAEQLDHCHEYDAEVVVGAAMYLMGAYPARPSRSLAERIVQHLEILQQHPGCSAGLRQLAAKLAVQWSLHGAALPADARTHALTDAGSGGNDGQIVGRCAQPRRRVVH